VGLVTVTDVDVGLVSTDVSTSVTNYLEEIGSGSPSSV